MKFIVYLCDSTTLSSLPVCVVVAGRGGGFFYFILFYFAMVKLQKLSTRVNCVICCWICDRVLNVYKKLCRAVNSGHQLVDLDD